MRVDGVDRLPELLADRPRSRSPRVGPARSSSSGPSAPSRPTTCATTTCFDDGARRAAARCTPRAREVMDIEGQLLEMYRDPTLDHKPALLAERGGAFYSEAAAQLIASLHDGRRRRPGGRRAERWARCRTCRTTRWWRSRRASTGTGHTRCRWRPSLRSCSAWSSRRRRSSSDIAAALSGDRDGRSGRCMANPLVGGHRIAAPLLDELLSVNREYLPRFFAGG